MKKHSRKLIAPVIISVLLVLYYIFIAAVFVTTDGIPTVAKFFMVIIPLALSGVMIGVLISRINEIRSGEEDDISKY